MSDPSAQPSALPTPYPLLTRSSPLLMTASWSRRSDTPWNIREQQEELRRHLESYPEHYPKVTPEQLVNL